MIGSTDGFPVLMGREATSVQWGWVVMKGTIRKLIKSKFYTKLVGSFLVILIVSALFIIGSNMLSYGKTRDQYQQQLQERLDSSASVVGSQMMMAFRLGSSLFQQFETIMYFKPEESQTVESQSEVWRVQELIREDENAFTPLVHSIFTYFPSDATVLTSAGKYDKDFYFSSINAYESFDQHYWDTSFSTAGRRVVLPETNIMTRSGLVKVLPVVTVSRLSGQIIVHVCNISSSYIAKLLSIHGVVGNTHLIVDKDYTPIYGQMDFFPPDFKEKGTIPPSMILLSSTNEETGLSFHELISEAWLKGILSKMYYPSLILVLVLLGGGILLILYVSLRFYRPIDEMKTLMPHESLVGRIDELTSIKTEMEELLSKENQHQQQELGFQLEFARHSIHLLIHGIQPKELARAIAVLETQRDFIYSHYLCCTALIEFLPAFYEEFSDSQQIIFRSSIPHKLRSFISERVPVLVVALEEDFYDLVFNIDTPEGKALVVQLLEEGASGFAHESRYYCVSFGLGKPVESISLLSATHSQAMAALQVRKSSHAFQIIDFEQLPPKKKVAFSFYDQKGIANNIEMGNAEVLAKYLASIIEKNEQRRIEAENMAELYRQILLVGRRSLEEHGYHLQEVQGYLPLYGSLSELHDQAGFAGLKDELCRVFIDIQELVHVHAEVPQRGCIQEVKQYLEAHYNQPLSLDIVADQCGLSPKYLSRLFKEETGENFSDYLVQLRVEKAKQMLCESNAKIGDISISVGIESRATFLRTFQKVEGITPSEYRKLEKYKQTKGE